MKHAMDWNRRRILTKYLAAIVSLGCSAGSATADTFALKGDFDDPLNVFLASGDLGTAQFTDDNEVANNVALYTLTVQATSTVRFISKGFASGGADPYFTLFQGNGTSSSFLASNYMQAFSTGGDINLSFLLSTGDYIIALGTFANMSLAENYGSGTLGDGFGRIGVPGSLKNSYYELVVTTVEGPIRIGCPTGALINCQSDTDGDGMPDSYEDVHGFDRNDSADAEDDADYDGLTNLNELQVGTDPLNPKSFFRIIAIKRVGNDIHITWKAGGGHAYQLQVSSGPHSNSFANIGAPFFVAGNGDVTMTSVDVDGATNYGPDRFYRVRLFR